MSESPCTFLEWDSQFFGVRIARVNGAHMDAARRAAVKAWAQEQNIACVYFLADSTDPVTVRTTEEGDFRLQDVRITLGLARPADPAPLTETPAIRPARAADADILRETARHAYIHSRFYNDPHFTEEQCASLYDVWLTRSITDPTYADQTFVADVNGEPAGYIALHLNRSIKQGTIGLVGVAETARGQAFGQILVQHALSWFWDQGMESAQVTTQGRNIGGQRLYQRCGFLTQSLFLWYHWWPSDRAE
jgi:dTDP-4-amino-4,6-dideoxy-D-galactose acyltransferase